MSQPYIVDAAKISAFMNIVSHSIQFAPELNAMTTQQLVTELASYSHVGGRNAGGPATDIHFKTYNPVYAALDELHLYKIATTGANGALTSADVSGFTSNIISNLLPNQSGWTGMMWSKIHALASSSPVYLTPIGIDTATIWVDANPSTI